MDRAGLSGSQEPFRADEARSRRDGRRPPQSCRHRPGRRDAASAYAGRAILGIGTGEREGNEPYGVDWSKPVARTIEALATIRALWASPGELVTRDSPFFPLRDAIFDLPPYRGKYPEIWVASHGPRMLRATGRYADGWFPVTHFQPEEYAAALEVVRTAASDAGRDPMSIVPASYVFVVTGRSRDEVDETLGSAAHPRLRTQSPCHRVGRHGGRHPFGDDFTGDRTSSRRPSMKRRWLPRPRTSRIHSSRTAS